MAVLGIVFAIISNSSGSGSGTAAGANGPEHVPIEAGTPLADLSKAATGQPLNGVVCGSTEQLAYHIHSRLTIYVDGVLKPVPAGIGIVKPLTQGSGAAAFTGAGPGGCYYWLHTHAQDGILHVESPTTKLYPLSDVFALWGQSLSATQVGPAKGTVIAYVNGKKFAGDPQTITLQAHEDIQLDIGKDVPPVTINWSATTL